MLCLEQMAWILLLTAMLLFCLALLQAAQILISELPNLWQFNSMFFSFLMTCRKLLCLWYFSDLSYFSRSRCLQKPDPDSSAWTWCRHHRQNSCSQDGWWWEWNLNQHSMFGFLTLKCAMIYSTFCLLSQNSCERHFRATFQASLFQ